jgi:hypothetical protein
MASIVADRRVRCGGRSGIDVGTRPWYVQRETPNPGTLLANWTRAPLQALLAEAAIPDEILSQPPLPGQTAPVLRSLATLASGLRGYGFGGARIADLPSLPGICRPGELAFYGIDLELNRKYGAPNPGAAGFVRRHTACMAPGPRRAPAAATMSASCPVPTPRMPSMTASPSPPTWPAWASGRCSWAATTRPAW